MSIESVISSNCLILCCPLYPLPSIFPSIRVFSNEPALCIRWPKYQSFNVSPSSEYSGLISFRIDWFDLLAVQRTLKNLLQHQFFDVQPSLWSSSHILSCLDLSKLSFQGASVLISWLQSTLAVILEPKKTESVTPSTFPPLFVRK